MFARGAGGGSALDVLVVRHADDSIGATEWYATWTAGTGDVDVYVRMGAGVSATRTLLGRRLMRVHTEGEPARFTDGAAAGGVGGLCPPPALLARCWHAGLLIGGRSELEYAPAQPPSPGDSGLRGSIVCGVHVWAASVPVCVCDIDGTITRSDLGGHVSSFAHFSYAHAGVCALLSALSARGYGICYVTARPLTGAVGIDRTRHLLFEITKDAAFACRPPAGPIFTSALGTLGALRDELLGEARWRKVATLSRIRALFASSAGGDETAGGGLYCGFGNRLNDVLAYREAGIADDFIFLVTHSRAVRAVATDGGTAEPGASSPTARGSGGGSPIGGNPIGGSPIGGNQIGGSPIGGNPIGGNPIGGNPIGGSPSNRRGARASPSRAPKGASPSRWLRSGRGGSSGGSGGRADDDGARGGARGAPAAVELACLRPAASAPAASAASAPAASAALLGATWPPARGASPQPRAHGASEPSSPGAAPDSRAGGRWRSPLRPVARPGVGAVARPGVGATVRAAKPPIERPHDCGGEAMTRPILAASRLPPLAPRTCRPPAGLGVLVVPQAGAAAQPCAGGAPAAAAPAPPPAAIAVACTAACRVRSFASFWEGGMMDALFPLRTTAAEHVRLCDALLVPHALRVRAFPLHAGSGEARRAVLVRSARASLAPDGAAAAHARPASDGSAAGAPLPLDLGRTPSTTSPVLSLRGAAIDAAPPFLRTKAASTNDALLHAASAAADAAAAVAQVAGPRREEGCERNGASR
ncbi:hypothetical protein KFE25_011955, partial [Diacronema lutheri]